MQAASPPPTGSTTLNLRPILESAAGARRAIDGLLAGTGLREVRDRVRLLTTELVANSVLHAGLGPLDAITLEVKVTEALVRVEVRDPGRGMRPHAAPDGEGQPGRGLLLVGALADRWGFSGRGPTRVWFELALPAPVN